MNDRRYEVLGPIGTGGFGTVYRARMLGPEGFSKLVALKVAGRIGDTQEMMSRLRDEARMLGLVNHRAIVAVDTLVKLDGAWTVVMEYVDGVDLARLVKAGPVPPAVALEIIGEVADALHVAYNTRGPNDRRLRLIHRDIKLGNIVVTAAGEVKVLDFGIASAAFEDRESMEEPTNLGSFGYLSPERLEGSDGPAGDVYALGVVLAEMLTGTRVGRTSSRLGKHITRVEGVVERVRDMVGRDDLALFVKDLLGFYPEGRPSIRAVARRCADLQAVVPGGRLRDWAESVLPSLIKLRDERASHIDPGPFRAGLVLHEAPLTRPPAPVVQRVAPNGRSPAPRRGGLVPVLVLLLIGVSSALGWTVLGPDAAAPRAATASVVVTGDATSVVLQSEQGRFVVPGEVPPGRYEVRAVFDQGEVPTGTVDLVQFAEVQLQCSGSFARCTVGAGGRP